MKNRFSEEEKLKRSMNSKNNFYCMFRSSLFIYSSDLYRYLPDGRFSGKDYIKIVARYLSGPYNKMCQEYGKKRINNWLQSRYLRIRSDLFQPVMPSPHIIHTNGKKKIVIKDSIQYWQKKRIGSYILPSTSQAIYWNFAPENIVLVLRIMICQP